MMANKKQTNLFSFIKPPSNAPPIKSNPKQETKVKKNGTKTYRFQDSWKKDFNWLCYEPEKNYMYCSFCRQFDKSGKKNAFRDIEGCTSFLQRKRNFAFRY